MPFFPSHPRGLCQCHVQNLPGFVYVFRSAAGRPYNSGMTVPPKLPSWLRRSHPIVRRYLRQPVSVRFQALLLTLCAVVFFLFGGLSLPVLYGLFSLIILTQVTISSADKIYSERKASTWDLMRLAPFTRRELLLSLWAASMWQINRTWMMIVYRLLHGAVIVGLMVSSLIFAEIPSAQTLPLLLSGTLLIAAQPFTEMYFSGMVGLAGANHVKDQASARSLAVGVVIVYWLSYVGAILAFLVLQQMRLTGTQMIGLFLLPLLLPIALGYAALRIAESALR
jgi:hypothetical protein